MGYSIGILNNIRANASQEYQNRIPEATQQNIATIGNALQTYTLLYNEFCEALVNKIGKTILEQKLFKNKLAQFKSGTIATQQDVEEIFIEMAKAEGSYDKTGPNPLGRREPPDVKTLYHRMNRQDYYVVSIGDIDFVRVFRSEATLDSFISGLINSVYSGAAYDEWLAMKNLIATYDGYADAVTMSINDFGNTMAMMQLNGQGEALPTMLNAYGGGDGMEAVQKSGAISFVKTVRKIVNDLTVAPSTNYNAAGVSTWCDKSDLVILLHKDVAVEIDVDVLAHAFNVGKTDIEGRIIIMDDFGSMDTFEYSLNGETRVNLQTYAIIVDKNWFRVWDTLSHMEPQRNAQGLFTNYFYHVHQILSASRFKPAVRIGAPTD